MTNPDPPPSETRRVILGPVVGTPRLPTGPGSVEGRVAIRSKRKYCPDCRALKSVDEFYSRKCIGKDGTLTLYPSTYCIPCQKTRSGYINRQRKARRIGSPQ